MHVYREEPDDENAESWKLICRYAYCDMLSNIVLKFWFDIYMENDSFHIFCELLYS